MRSHAQKYFNKKKVGAKKFPPKNAVRIPDDSNNEKTPVMDAEGIPEIPITENEVKKVEETINPFVSFISRFNLTPSLPKFFTTENATSSNVSYILEELNGARELEILNNQVNEVLSTLNSPASNTAQMPLLQKELLYLATNLRGLFPRIALNPLQCEKWSTVLRVIVDSIQKIKISTMHSPVSITPRINEVHDDSYRNSDLSVRQQKK